MIRSRPRIDTDSLIGRRVKLAAPLFAALLVGLALRLWLWGNLPRTGMISDEGEYLSAASWLAHGYGFDWYQGYLWTRAPLYPLFLAAHLRIFGDTLTPIYATQTLLSMVNVVLVYGLARYLADGRASDNPLATARISISGLASLLMALYLPFATYSQMLLSETLFITLLLGGFLALARATSDWKIDDRGTIATVGQSSIAVAGALFGLAALTRSITLLFLPIVALWLLAGRTRPAEKRDSARATPGAASLLAALLFLVCAGALILPWTLYNSRKYGGLVVIDTSGAFNLMLGGRAAYDGRRQDAPPRNFVLALLDPRLELAQRCALLADSCLLRRDDARLLEALSRQDNTLSQGERQRLMTAEGLCLIGERPLAFVGKSLGELIDLFQINYSGDERFADGFTTGRLPRWYTLGLFLLDDTLYVLVLPLAVLGWALKLRIQNEERRNQESAIASFSILHSQFFILIGLWWLYNIALAPLLFAINRFRLPLLPFAFIFAAYALAAVVSWVAPGRTRIDAGRRGFGLVWGALALLLATIATTPYAYLQPAAVTSDGESQRSVPSYLGPPPSSIDSTWRALAARPRYLATQQLQLALEAGQIERAETLLRSGAIDPRIVTLSRALLAGQRGRYDEGLEILSVDAVLASDKSYRVLASVVRGDLLRSAGRLADARAALGGSDRTRFVDDANPVQWAWDWLRPAPLADNHLDLAGDLDLGYIAGCYLGEGDPEAQGTFRWCGDRARLRFPGAGTGAPQTLALRADGRGWLGGWLPVPPVQVFLGGQLAGTFTPSHTEVQEFSVALPPTPPGADVVVMLRTPTFIPDAARYLSQQGSQVGQAQRLGVRLDWADLRK
jgi:4-amino-4-deoxy-L-arabinose transferase-like glycosyltransferase